MNNDQTITARKPWERMPWAEQSARIDAMHRSMAAELQQPQHGPQRMLTTEPACVDLPYHNNLQMDAIPCRIQADLTPFAARVIVWGLQEAMRTGDASDHPETHDEIRALIETLSEAGDYGDFLPQESEAYQSAENAGLTDTIAEQRARADWQQKQHEQEAAAFIQHLEGMGWKHLGNGQLSAPN